MATADEMTRPPPTKQRLRDAGPAGARHRRSPGTGPAAGKASPWNVDDHLVALNNALAQLPEHERGQVLVRADTGACSKLLLGHITDAGLEYSIGFQAHETVKTAIEVIPEQAWRAALDSEGQPRDGAQVAELTAWMPTPVPRTGRRVRVRRTGRPGCG